MTRKTAFEVIKVAGYHGDQKTFMRTYVEQRISLSAARQAYDAGAQAKRQGMRCTCYGCTKT